MEKTINEGIHQKLGMAQSDSMFTEVDAVQLTPDEELSALRAYKSKKLALQKERAYWEKVSKPIVYPVMDASGYGVFVLQRIRQTVPDFVIDAQNHEIFKLLCWYYTNDLEFEKAGYRLDKGIALIGPVGCGKTTLLRGFAVNPKNPYGIVSCRKVADDYSLTSQDKKSEGGARVIKHYSGLLEVNPREFWGHSMIGFGFDDLGTESIAKHFGNEKNVMADIILNRNDVDQLKGKTHLTSNLSADDVEAFYGPRVRSRLRGMFNWMTFDISAKDRRI